LLLIVSLTEFLLILPDFDGRTVRYYW
jgi:hypothetical protein